MLKFQEHLCRLTSPFGLKANTTDSKKNWISIKKIQLREKNPIPVNYNLRAIKKYDNEVINFISLCDHWNRLFVVGGREL